MSNDRPNPEGIPQIGEMPIPRYMSESPSAVFHGGMKRWIGIEAYSIEGELGEFHWWSNYYSKTDLSDKTTRHHVAALVARVAMVNDVQVAIGLPIDLRGSDPATGKVKIIDDPELLGVYVERKKRLMFNVLYHAEGLPSEAEVRRRDPVAFDELLRKAEAVLPTPNTPGAQASSGQPLDAAS